MPGKRKSRPLPSVGSTYERLYKGRTLQMTVVTSDSGRVAYQVLGKEFRSPSGAAKAVTGTEINGWEFWNISPE